VIRVFFLLNATLVVEILALISRVYLEYFFYPVTQMFEIFHILQLSLVYKICSGDCALVILIALISYTFIYIL
jgi:hypothetical protein